MAKLYRLQASGVMSNIISPPGWAFAFGIFVTDEDGVPITDLKKSHFHVYDLNSFGNLGVSIVSNIGVDLPTSKLSGIYRVQTNAVLGDGAPQPQEFLFALRVARNVQLPSPGERRGTSKGKRYTTIEGETTVAITYLGKWH